MKGKGKTEDLSNEKTVKEIGEKSNEVLKC